MSLVVVGDAERLADPLRELGFTDLVVVAPEQADPQRAG